MNINGAFPSKYLAASDVPEDRDMILTVRDVEIRTLGQGDDSDDKPVVEFHETDKTLILNKTNAGTIAALYGPETDDWIGKRIALFATEVEFKGKMTLGLRVRTKAPKATAARSEAQPAPFVAKAPVADIDDANDPAPF